MIRILTTCLPILLMILTGMLCRRKAILTQDGVETLKKVILTITLPALMFSAFAKIDYSFDNVLILLIMLTVCMLGVGLGTILQKLLRIPSRFMPYVTTGFELGMLGYPLFATLYPAESLSSLACIDIGLTLFSNTIYRLMLNRVNSRARMSGRQFAHDIFASPVVLGIIAGVVTGATGLYKALEPSGAAKVLDACTDFFGAPTAAIVLLTIGYDLVLKDVPWKSVLGTLLARIVIMALLRVGTGAAFEALGIGGFAHALNVVFILPPAFILPVFAADRDESAYIASCLSLNTVVTIMAFVALAFIG